MTHFRTRPMRPQDEENFNAVYNSLGAGIRPSRTLQTMHRIWHEGPGGSVRSWLIEAQTGPDTWQLAGHHGLCPIRYTCGADDFLFAKTVNSFLLPEFRNKFVYLRFEQRCLAEVEQQFDATYTLTQDAVRMRAALGYDASVRELDFERGLQRPQILSRLLTRLSWRYPKLPVAQLVQTWKSLPGRKMPRLPLMVLDNTAALASEFFASFWNETRLTAGLAPRRDAADLAWRFWNETDIRRTTLTWQWPSGARAFCVLRHDAHSHFTLEDIAISAPQPFLLEEFLDAAFAWCAGQGGLMLSFMTTPDSQPPAMLGVYRALMDADMSRRYRSQHMSRRLTVRGRDRLGEWPPCNVTAILAVA